MDLRLVSVVIGSVLLAFPTVLVLGQLRSCTNRERCTAISDCPEFAKYVGTPYATWPESVLSNAKQMYCGSEQRGWTKTHKVCCRTSVQVVDQFAPLAKKGRDLLNMTECGKQSKTRIAHGKVAEVFEFPWMALLQGFDGSFHCGGSLIAERYVLTAAHCNKIRVYSVRLGETDISQKEDCIRYPDGDEECSAPPQDIPVEKFMKNRLHSASQKKNDIALVRLQWAAQLSDSVRPICLPLPEVSRKTLPKKMTVSGWGYTEVSKMTSNQLRYASIPIQSLTRCNQTLRRLKTDWSVDQSQICAGADDDKADNCHGDSGGPLQYFGKTGFVIHGIVSYGVSTCGTEAEPGIYTKVSHYMDWIIDNLI
uniref:Putative trypsin n=1 Tax=Aedes albopictus TaxID=7160 RepID=A0A023EQR4_AEDAL|nr:phenoloxidase-activating factor 3-like [Aedes albopictus]